MVIFINMMIVMMIIVILIITQDDHEEGDCCAVWAYIQNAGVPEVQTQQIILN